MRRTLITLAKVALLGIIIYLVLHKTDTQLLSKALRESHAAWLLWATLWFVISKIIAARRFRLLLAAEGYPVEAKAHLKLYWAGMYYNLLLPGGISGDGYKIKILRDALGLSLKRLTWITLLDRLTGAAALAQLGMLLLCFLPPSAPYTLLWATGLVCSIPVLSWIYRRSGKGLGQVWGLASLQSLGVQGAQTVAALGLIWSQGLGSDAIAYATLFLVSSIVAMAPLTLGGAGARELTFLYGADLLGLQPERAVVIAFLFYALSTLVALSGALYSFRDHFFAIPNKRPNELQQKVHS